LVALPCPQECTQQNFISKCDGFQKNQENAKKSTSIIFLVDISEKSLQNFIFPFFTLLLYLFPIKSYKRKTEKLWSKYEVLSSMQQRKGCSLLGF